MAGARFLDPSSIPLKRQSGGNIWATLVHITQAVMVILALSGLLLCFLPVIQRGNRLKEERSTKEREIAAAMDEQRQLQLETEHLKNDPSYVEHISRDQLFMGKPGETIIRFDPYVTTSAANSRTPSPKAESETTSN